jgi:DNA-binding XRE family transcriptional regulator
MEPKPHHLAAAQEAYDAVLHILSLHAPTVQPGGHPVPPGTWHLKMWQMLGPQLRERRRDCGISLRDMANAIGAPQRSLRDIESGTGTAEEYSNYFWRAWDVLDRNYCGM